MKNNILVVIVVVVLYIGYGGCANRQIVTKSGDMRVENMVEGRDCTRHWIREWIWWERGIRTLSARREAELSGRIIEVGKAGGK